MRKIAHLVDEVCKEVETRRLPPGGKRGGKKEDSSKPSACPSSKRMFRFFPNKTSSDHLDEEASSSLKEKRNEAETKIHEVEVECSARFLVGDMQITDRDVGSCMGGETPFGSYPKGYYKSEL